MLSSCVGNIYILLNDDQELFKEINGKRNVAGDPDMKIAMQERSGHIPMRHKPAL